MGGYQVCENQHGRIKGMKICLYPSWNVNPNTSYLCCSSNNHNNHSNHRNPNNNNHNHNMTKYNVSYAAGITTGHLTPFRPGSAFDVSC